MVEILEKTGEADNKKFIDDMVEDISKMLRKFVQARMYTFVDKLANATNKEIVQATLYEALRISRSAMDSNRPLYEGEDFKVYPYLARKEYIDKLLEILDSDLVYGLELVRKISIKALALPGKKSKEEEEGEE